MTERLTPEALESQRPEFFEWQTLFNQLGSLARNPIEEIKKVVSRSEKNVITAAAENGVINHLLGLPAENRLRILQELRPIIHPEEAGLWVQFVRKWIGDSFGETAEDIARKLIPDILQRMNEIYQEDGIPRDPINALMYECFKALACTYFRRGSGELVEETSHEFLQSDLLELLSAQDPTLYPRPFTWELQKALFSVPEFRRFLESRGVNL